jgi:hypothetical protein
MSTLNLNLELAEQAIRRLESTHGTVCDEIKNVQRQAYGVLQDGGNWMGMSAKQFFDQFLENDNCLHAVILDYQQLAVLLQGEVDQWKAISGKLVGS